MPEQSEQQFRAIADAAPVMLGTTVPEGPCNFISRSWYEFTGQAPGHGLGWGWMEAMHADDCARVLHTFLEANARREPFSIEYRLRRHDGVYCESVGRGRPRFGADGSFLGYVAASVDISEAKRTQVELAASEAKFATAFNEAPLALCITALDDGQLVDVNQGLLRLGGYRREEVLGKTPESLGFWIQPELRHERFARLAAGQAVPQIEAGFRAKSGAELRGIISSALVEIDGRRCVLSCIADMTERVRVEAALREHQQRLAGELAAMQQLQRFSTQMIHEDKAEALYDKLLDTAVAIMGSDFASVQMLHAARGPSGELELLGHRGFNAAAARFWKWVPHNSAGSCGMALRSGQRVIVEDIHACAAMQGTADLEVFTDTGIASVQTTPLVSRDGRLLGMISTHWKNAHRPTEKELQLFDVLARQAADLVERSQSAAELARSESRAKLALDVGRLGTWSWHIAGGQVQADARCREIIGLPPEGSIAAADVKERVHPQDYARVEQAQARALSASGDGRFSEEFRFLHSDGGLRWVAARSQTRFEQGEGRARASHTTGTVLDISERKFAEEALAQADRRKDEFLAMLAHELRNPLAPIHNAVQLLNSSGSDAGVAQAVAPVLTRQVGQMIRLVDDLLDVSRITRGKIELKKDYVELATVIRHAAEAAQPLRQSMGHELQVLLPNEPVLLEADSARLVQIVANLLSNACKFTPRGGRIELHAEACGAEALIRVRDSGIGIAADQLPRVFDLFAQVDTSLQRTQGGLGIGLTLVKTLAEMHGGTVEARSSGAGQGSEFTVRLPLRTAPPSQAMPLPTALPVRAPEAVLH